MMSTAEFEAYCNCDLSTDEGKWLVAQTLASEHGEQYVWCPYCGDYSDSQGAYNGSFIPASMDNGRGFAQTGGCPPGVDCEYKHGELVSMTPHQYDIGAGDTGLLIGRMILEGAVTGLAGEGLGLLVLRGGRWVYLAYKASQASKASASATYTYTKTAASHLTEYIKTGEYAGKKARSYMDSPLLIQEIINTGKGVVDKYLPNALRFEVEGAYRNSVGTYELVIDPKTNLIYHFLFR